MGVITYWAIKPHVGSASLKICLNVKLCNADHIQLILSFPEKSRKKQWNKTNGKKWRLHQLAYLYFRLEIKSFGKLYLEYLSLKTWNDKEKQIMTKVMSASKNVYVSTVLKFKHNICRFQREPANVQEPLLKSNIIIIFQVTFSLRGFSFRHLACPHKICQTWCSIE